MKSSSRFGRKKFKVDDFSKIIVFKGGRLQYSYHQW